MTWEAHFKSAFFSIWNSSGMPAPYSVADYRKVLEALGPPARMPLENGDACHPLNERVMNDVYRFGAFIGCTIGRLLDVPECQIRSRADWCGRFNVGISLFDYIVDEGDGGTRLRRMAPFDRLFHRAPLQGEPIAQPSSPTERYLCANALVLLDELETLIGKPTRSEPPAHELWRELTRMLEAEVAIAHASLTKTRACTELDDAALLKSVGPFMTIAKRMVLEDDHTSQLGSSAESLGFAIGRCYSLVDDAVDLWRDYDSERWNTVLLAASRRCRSLFEGAIDLRTELRLSELLLKQTFVDDLVVPVVFSLRDELNQFSSKDRDSAAGMIGASLACWG